MSQLGTAAIVPDRRIGGFQVLSDAVVDVAIFERWIEAVMASRDQTRKFCVRVRSPSTRTGFVMDAFLPGFRGNYGTVEEIFSE